MDISIRDISVRHPDRTAAVYRETKPVRDYWMLGGNVYTQMRDVIDCNE